MPGKDGAFWKLSINFEPPGPVFIQSVLREGVVVLRKRNKRHAKGDVYFSEEHEANPSVREVSRSDNNNFVIFIADETCASKYHAEKFQ